VAPARQEEAEVTVTAPTLAAPVQPARRLRRAGAAAAVLAALAAGHANSMVARAAPAQVTVPILMYHYVRVNPVPMDRLGFNLSVTPGDFVAQMALLRAEGVHTVSMHDVMDALDFGRPLPPRPVVLTFDDGHDDFATQAVPVLLRNGFTATNYVVSGFLGRPSYMSGSQLSQVVAEGMTIGAHTVNHPALTSLSAAAAQAEISNSRATLRQLTGQPVDDFAYPYGAHNAAIDAMVRNAGFRDAVTTAGGSVLQTGQRFDFPRVRVPGGESLATFAASVGVSIGRPVALVPTPSSRGYTIVASDGGAYPLGDAPGGLSLATLRLAQPLVAAAPAPGGTWVVARDGGIFATGQAPFYGSMGGRRLAAPIVGIASTPTGHGYWLVASDGGIFAFGDAAFHGSMGGRRLNAPVVGMVADSGGGYRMFASDGGLFAFGATFLGSMGGQHLAAPIVAVSATADGAGYWMLSGDGGVFTFGDAHFEGTTTRPL